MDIEHVVNVRDEKNFESQVEAIIALHDFLRDNPNPEVKEIAKFLPPIDARVVKVAIERLSIRDKKS